MIRLFLLTIGMFVLSSTTEASSFYSCKVYAKIAAVNVSENSFDIEVLDSIVVGGQAGPTGKPCRGLPVGTKQSIVVEGSKVENKKHVVLDYSYKDGLSREGLVISERWKVNSYVD